MQPNKGQSLLQPGEEGKLCLMKPAAEVSKLVPPFSVSHLQGQEPCCSKSMEYISREAAIFGRGGKKVTKYQQQVNEAAIQPAPGNLLLPQVFYDHDTA